MNIEQKIRIVGSAFDALLKSNAAGLVSAAGGTANCMAGKTALFFGISYQQAHYLLNDSLPDEWYDLLNQACGIACNETNADYENSDSIPAKWMECLRQAREGVQP